MSTMNNTLSIAVSNRAHTKSSDDPSSSETSISSLQSLNKAKISFTTFYYYLSKFEIQIAELESLLYWTSISELFFFTLGIIIYFAHPDTLDFLWLFIVHLFRAINGFVFLVILPRTFQAIETIHIPSKVSVAELEAQMKTLYKGYFSRKRSNIRAVFVVYVILTIICNSVNDYVFFAIFRILCVGKFKLKNFLTIGFVIVYYFCNGVYFSWFSTLRNTMPTLSSYLIRIVFNEIKSLFGLLKRCRNKKKVNEEMKQLDNTSIENSSGLSPRNVSTS